MLLQLFGSADMSLSENLQRLRKERGLNQDELSEQSGVSLTQISKIERSETDPRVSTIEKLAKALGCSMDEMLFNEASQGLSGLMKRAFERASKLDPLDKAALLKVINMACAGGTMIKTLDDIYLDANQQAEMVQRVHGQKIHPDDAVVSEMSFHEMIVDQNRDYHKRIDELADAEAKTVLEWKLDKSGEWGR
ncbi:MAG: helix-turn-helix transcriptional regulator [Pseudohongiella sp.]|nr:helix-turn-helix transcriptional regulator [Pseudohongiella sp.]MDP2091424.1 helix-turn-helix transcriptional regulator [Pseudohongiella sp.]